MVPFTTNHHHHHWTLQLRIPSLDKSLHFDLEMDLGSLIKAIRNNSYEDPYQARLSEPIYS
jgi:hypothetical protein